MLKHVPRGESIDRVFHALADPSRRVIVERLSRGPASVSELARPLPMSLPAVVQHLQVLETSGLVRSEKIGRVRTCQIEPAALRPWSNGSAHGGRAGSAASTALATTSPKATTNRKGASDERTIRRARHLCRRARATRPRPSEHSPPGPIRRPRRAGSSTPDANLELDFRVGGRERSRGTAPDGRAYTYEALYQDIVPARRIVYTYDMLLDGDADLGLPRHGRVQARARWHPPGLHRAGRVPRRPRVPARRAQGMGSLLDSLERGSRARLRAAERHPSLDWHIRLVRHEARDQGALHRTNCGRLTCQPAHARRATSATDGGIAQPLSADDPPYAASARAGSIRSLPATSSHDPPWATATRASRPAIASSSSIEARTAASAASAWSSSGAASTDTRPSPSRRLSLASTRRPRYAEIVSQPIS